MHYDEPVERIANIILDQFLGAVQVEITDCSRSGIIVTREEAINDDAKKTEYKCSDVRVYVSASGKVTANNT